MMWLPTPDPQTEIRKDGTGRVVSVRTMADLDYAARAVIAVCWPGTPSVEWGSKTDAGITYGHVKTNG